ncbi:MAG: hypothetical protein ACLPY5_14950 [Candidatus Bathyarchaeia archaeon]
MLHLGKVKDQILNGITKRLRNSSGFQLGMGGVLLPATLELRTSKLVLKSHAISEVEKKSMLLILRTVMAKSSIKLFAA